jgi:hypothetical protein
MQADDIIWQVINHGHCSYKSKYQDHPPLLSLFVHFLFSFSMSMCSIGKEDAVVVLSQPFGEL